VYEGIAKRERKRSSVLWAHEKAILTGGNNVTDCPDVRCHDRCAARERFQHDVGTTLAFAGKAEYVRGAVPKRQLLMCNFVQEMYVGELQIRNEAAQDAAKVVLWIHAADDV
jgi:hypothetical protein